MNPQKKNKRLKFNLGSFDLIKGFAIMVIILGHMCYFYDLKEMTYFTPLIFFLKPMGFLMPMFFWVSGFGFREKRAEVVFKSTVKSFLYPYAVIMVLFSVIYLTTYFFYYGNWSMALQCTFAYLLAFLLGIPKPGKIIRGFELGHCSAAWFFLASFLAFNLLNLILKFKNKRLQTLLVIGCFLVGYFINIHDVNYYCVPQGLMALGYFYAGYIFKQYRLLEFLRTKIWIYLVLIPVTLIHFLLGNFNLCLGEFNYGLLDCIGAGCSALLLILAGIFLDRFEWKCFDLLRKIGLYSYWILCVHVIENDCMHWEAFISSMPNQPMAYCLELLLKILIISLGCMMLKKITQYRYKRKRAIYGI